MKRTAERAGPRAALLTALLVVVAASFWWRASARRGAPREPGPFASHGPAESDSPLVSGPALAVGERAAAASPERIVEGSITLEIPAAPPVLDAAGRLRVAGLDAAGGELWTRDVPVAAGRFRLAVEPCAELVFGEAELAGRAARLVPERVSGETAGPLALTARWRRGQWLHVIDAETGQHLNGVQIVRRQRWPEAMLAHPGDLEATESVLRAGVSPLWFATDVGEDRDLWLESVWVGATDHAWASVDLDHEPLRPLVVRLERSAVLEVSCLAAPAGSAVRVRREGEAQPLVSLPARTDGLHRIDGLERGAVRVSLEQGAWIGRAEELDGASVTLAPGRLTAVTLGSTRAPDARGTLDVSVLLDADGTPEAQTLHVYPEGAGALDPGHLRIARSKLAQDGQTLVWHGELPAGRYRVGLAPLVLLAAVEVAPHARTEAVLDARSGVRARWTVVEGEGTRTAAIPWLLVYPLGPDGARGLDPRKVEPDAAGEFECTVFAEGVEVAVDAEGWQPLRQTFALDTTRPQAHFTLHLRQACVVELVPAATLPRPPRFRVAQVECLRGEGRWLSTTLGEESLRVQVSHPGSYRLELSGVAEGAQLVYVVDVSADQVARVEVR